MRSKSTAHDAVVVGAGPAGIGAALALQDAGVSDVVVLERATIGASLRSWPQEMRCITPSFQGNQFGAADLNAVAPNTSPAFSLDVEHPTGAQWAAYLDGVADHYSLEVREGIEVVSVHADDAGFTLETPDVLIRARHVVWAAGEFGAPRLDLFPGAELCRPAGSVRSWHDVGDDEVVVIGGFESGIDAAATLVEARPSRRVVVIDPAAPWERRHDDPSVTLTPFTRGRLDAALTTGRLDLRGDTRVASAVRGRGGSIELRCDDGSELAVPGAPILAAGYRPVLGPVERLVDVRGDGTPVVTEDDESTVTPGLFIAGPGLRHDGLIFCFAYKYRGRFPVVASSIAASLGREPAEELDAWRQAGMWLDDLSCCGDECAC